MSTALVWFRQDLRLHDNPALHHAMQQHETVIPVYIHAPDEAAPWPVGAASRWWLHHSLTALQQALRQRGSMLILRQGPSLAGLRELVEITGAQSIYWNRLYQPVLIARDSTIKTALRADGLQVESHNAALLWEPWTIKTAAGNPYKVFTPFWKAGLQYPPAPPLPAPAHLPAPSDLPSSLSLAEFELMPRINWYQGLQAAWRPGEEGALQQLDAFCQTVLDNYPDTRNTPAIRGVSRLSPHLHCGEISPRQIWQAVTHQINQQGLENPLQHPAAETYLRELGWREFAHNVLYHWPHTAEQPMDERFNDYPWRQHYEDLLAAWQQGRTGIPMVDAGMRELWHSGWMHNRVRMIVASFLTKNCAVPWQHGARWFWDTLVDADLASNSLGWQWTAGCGTDAAPYFRIFNPVRQGEQFDKAGDYVRRWIPQLAHVAQRWIHKPWQMPLSEQKSSNVIIGRDYPAPLVDLSESRRQALAGYEHIKQS